MLRGKLIDLRAIERSDIDKIMEWVNDPEVTTYLSSFLFPVSRAEEEKWFDSLENDQTSKVLAVSDKTTGEYLGSIGLHRIDWKNRNAELGIVLRKEYWNKGYGQDAIMTLLKHAFDEMNLEKVYLRVMEYNPRGIACYLACGFNREGVLRNHFYHQGRYWDVIMMGILRDEYRYTG